MCFGWVRKRRGLLTVDALPKGCCPNCGPRIQLGAMYYSVVLKQGVGKLGGHLP